MIRGLIRKVEHLVKVEELNEWAYNSWKFKTLS
jgi:hypothetical protein